MNAVLELPKTTKAKIANRTQSKIEVVERVILHNISWETYERILADYEDVSSPHFAYCDGDLEIMVMGFQHETLKMELSELVAEIARVLEIDYKSAGSTTFRKEKKKKGFEGDATFYFENVETVRRKKEIDLSKGDPPPELVIEVDITHGSLPRFPIFAGIGIAEVWRFDGDDVKIYRLENDKYQQVAESVCLPGVKSEIVTDLLFAAQELKKMDWVKLIHQTIKK
jgi:Uma2 family endonuclease